MLTIFATAKPFRGHAGRTECNAMQSWKGLQRGMGIIVFGADEGAAEAAREFGLRHEGHVERNEWGSKRLEFMFARAQVIGRHEILCYINCDIILMQDFRRALERVRAMHREFLMVGRRWDTDVTEPLAFERADWATELRGLAMRCGRKCTAEWIDYFAFSRGMYGADMPPFVLRVFWDNWLVWKALDAGKPVIDASRAVMGVHQNHDYSYHPQGKAGVWSGEEAGLNGQMAGGWRHLRTIADATEVLPPEKLKRNAVPHWAAGRRYARPAGRVRFLHVWDRVMFGG